MGERLENIGGALGTLRKRCGETFRETLGNACGALGKRLGNVCNAFGKHLMAGTARGARPGVTWLSPALTGVDPPQCGVAAQAGPGRFANTTTTSHTPMTPKGSADWKELEKLD